MWNEPSEEELEQLPRLYETEDTPLEEKLIHMHFFIGGCDWYAAEWDPGFRNFFGYVILNGDYQCAEWGEFSYEELRELRIGPGFEVDRDLHWTPKRAREIGRIQLSYESQGRSIVDR